MEYVFAILVLILVAPFVWAALAGALFEQSPSKRAPDPPRPPPREKKKALSAAETRGLIPTFPEALVVNIVDGDTCDVEAAGGKFRVRLDSIDCPEDGQPWGDIAKYGLIKMAGGQRMRLEIYGPDDYGRKLATIYTCDPKTDDWINVNERMVMLGHAWVMHRYYDHLPPDRQAKLN